MKIGALAKQANVNIDTVRYYERQGLLPAPQRLMSGYRQYEQGDAAFRASCQGIGIHLGRNP